MRVCSVPGCPTLVPAGTRGGRCRQHERETDRLRGTTAERGYGRDHVQLRRRWRSRIDAGGVPCARCGVVIEPGAAFDLDHDDRDRLRYLGPSHPACNRATAGRRPAGGVR